MKVATEPDHLSEVALKMMIKIENGLVMIRIVEIEMEEIEEVVSVHVVIMESLIEIGIVIAYVDREGPPQKVSVITICPLYV